jgi:hypothetical protein
MKLATLAPLALSALALVACDKLLHNNAAAGADAATDAAVVAVVDAGPETANEAKVTRYPDERKLEHEPATVKPAKVIALAAVPKGDTVATLKSGDAVEQVAEHNGYYLSVFADPADGSKKLMGWTQKFAFTDPPQAKKVPIPKCAQGEDLVSDKAQPLVPRCAKECGDDAECPSHNCELALMLDSKGAPTHMATGAPATMTVCAAVAADAGAGAASAAKDAGAAPSALPKCGNGTLVATGPTGTRNPPLGKPFCGQGCAACAKSDCISAYVLDDATGQVERRMNGDPLTEEVCKPK